MADQWDDPLFTKLCTPESIKEALADPRAASWILTKALADALYQAWRDYSRLLVEAERLRQERDLVYGELNKALGSHAPKAWDRIKAGLTS